MKCHHCPNRSVWQTSRRGFTLIELLLVLTILGILAAIVVPRLVGRTEDAKIKATIAQIASFKGALSTFEVDNGGFPRNLADLIQQPRDASGWKGPYLESDAIPKDGWGRDFMYTFPGKHNPSSYDIVSAGSDAQFGTDDDIGNWTKTR